MALPTFSRIYKLLIMHNTTHFLTETNEYNCIIKPLEAILNYDI